MIGRPCVEGDDDAYEDVLNDFLDQSKRLKDEVADADVQALKARQIELARELGAMKKSLQEQLADFTGMNLPNPDYNRYQIGGGGRGRGPYSIHTTTFT